MSYQNSYIEDFFGLDSAEALIEQIDRLITEIDSDPIPRQQENLQQAGAAKKRKTALSMISNTLFYGLLLFVIVLAFSSTGSNGNPRNFLGYSYMRVLSDSMQSEIPKGSLVITKQVEESAINVGDDITFFVTKNTTYTHRVIEIHEDYQSTGQRGFVTQGIENDYPDPDVVLAENVMGVVLIHFAGVGDIMKKVADNVWLVLAMFVLLMVFVTAICIYIKERKKAPSKPRKRKKRPKSASYTKHQTALV